MAIDTSRIIARRPEFARGLTGQCCQCVELVLRELVMVFVRAGVAVGAVVLEEMHVAEL